MLNYHKTVFLCTVLHLSTISITINSTVICITHKDSILNINFTLFAFWNLCHIYLLFISSAGIRGNNVGWIRGLKFQLLYLSVTSFYFMIWWISQEQHCVQIIVIKLFFFVFNEHDNDFTNRKPINVCGEKHLQAKPEKVHVVNANSLQPRGT